MQLFTAAQKEQMLSNGRASLKDPDFDPFSVVKLFTPDAGLTWLLSEIDPEDNDIAFGLCDLGQGFPELGFVSLEEIIALRGPFGLPIEHDMHFEATAPLSKYAEVARENQRIVEDLS